MKLIEIETQSLSRLFLQHRMAQIASKKHSSLATINYWQWFEGITSLEVERRADILPISLVIDLINSGLPFSTNQ